MIGETVIIKFVQPPIGSFEKEDIFVPVNVEIKAKVIDVSDTDYPYPDLMVEYTENSNIVRKWVKYGECKKV